MFIDYNHVFLTSNPNATFAPAYLLQLTMIAG